LPALAASLLLLALLQALPPRDVVRPKAAAPGTASISGRVYSATTGTPIRGALVTLAAGPPPEASNTRALVEAAKAGVATDAEGRFTLSGISAGSYYVIAMPATASARYLPAGYAATRGNDPGKAVTVADGARVGNVDIALPLALAIEGRVVDETGEPLSRVVIFAGRYALGSDVSQRVGGFGIQTDDLGRYRLYGLEPGTYVVAADGRSGVAFYESGERRFSASIVQRESEQFALTFHPSTVDESAAQRVRLSTQDVTGIDVTLLRSRPLQISGTVLDSRGQPAAFTTGSLVRRGTAILEARTFQTDPLGRFQTAASAPGEHRLLFGSGLSLGGSVNSRTEIRRRSVDRRR
jgi:hypothetical protein